MLHLNFFLDVFNLHLFLNLFYKLLRRESSKNPLPAKKEL